MFSGIVSEVGDVLGVSSLSSGREVSIHVSDDVCKRVKVGDSVAVNGVCSTLVSHQDGVFVFQYLPETLSKSNLDSLIVGAKVNIELSLRLDDFVSGHLVSGHVDAVGVIDACQRDDDWHVFRFSYPKKYSQLLVEKGWIVVDGIALTVVDLNDHFFTCHIIPHTYTQTVLSSKVVGDSVNLEFDMIAKYVQRFVMVNHRREI